MVIPNNKLVLHIVVKPREKHYLIKFNATGKILLNLNVIQSSVTKAGEVK